MSRRWLPILGVALGLAIMPAPAWAHGGPGGACAGPPSVSAINQYCEDIPSATGATTPLPGTPALQGSLPARVVRAIEHAPANSPVRRLLRLPASRRARSVLVLRPAATSSSLLALWLALALVALVALMVAAAQRRRHRQRAV
jgi:hypothetical protein